MLNDMTVYADNLAVIDANSRCDPEPKAQGTPLCKSPEPEAKPGS